MVHINDCPLCSSVNISLYLKCKDHFLSKEVFELFRCQGCGFVFTQDHPEENGSDRYYESDDYISHDDKSPGVLNKIYLLARKIMLTRKREIVESAAGLKRGSLLDIGCGTGYFAGAMKNAGWLVTGLEPNKKAREFSSRKFDLNIISPEQILKLSSDSFDCITLWHVLEHLNNPFQYAGEFVRLLKPEGVCIIAVPNCSSFDAQYYREYWAAYDVPRHLWHFNPHTIRIFSQRSGFKVERQLNLPFDVFYISILSERYRGSIAPLLKGMFIGKLFWILSVFRNQRSSSIIYLLRK
jgi:SAM-dependent methyltransferase